MFFIVCGVVRALENPFPSLALSHTRACRHFLLSCVSLARTNKKKRLGVLTIYTDHAV